MQTPSHANGFNQIEDTWQDTWLIEIKLSECDLFFYEQIWHELAQVISCYEILDTACLETSNESLWMLQFYCDYQPNLKQWVDLCKVSSFSINQLQLTKIPATDWVKQVQLDFPPVKIANFFIYGSHFKQRISSNLIAIEIDASRAFGTGEHATTSLCLSLIAFVAKQQNCYNILDMGCGSGILAIACAKVWPANIAAADIDADSVEITKRNLKLNRVKANIFLSNGCSSKRIKQYGSYDLIVANILAKPLLKLAKYLKSNLKVGGKIILSGILNSQEQMIIKSYRSQHLIVNKISRRNGWSAILLSSVK